MLMQYTEPFFSDEGLTAGSWSEDNALPNTLSDVLDYFARTYFVSSAANIAAGLAGEKFYEYDIGHGVTRAYCETAQSGSSSRQRRIESLPCDKDSALHAMLGQTGILSYYLLTTLV